MAWTSIEDLWDLRYSKAITMGYVVEDVCSKHPHGSRSSDFKAYFGYKYNKLLTSDRLEARVGHIFPLIWRVPLYIEAGSSISRDSLKGSAWNFLLPPNLSTPLLLCSIGNPGLKILHTIYIYIYIYILTRIS